MSQPNEPKQTVVKYFRLADEVERDEHIRRYELDATAYVAVNAVKLAGRKIVGQIQD